MKKIVFKQIVSIAFAASLALLFLVAFHAAEMDSAETNASMQERMTTQEKNVKKNNNLLHQMRQSIVQTNPAIDPDTIERYYPDYYGGSYLNDKGQLVILVTDDTEEIKQKICSFAGSDDIIFEPARFSYAQLEKIQSDVMQQKSRLSAQSNNPALRRLAEDIVACHLNDRYNHITVDIKHLNDEKVQLFKQAISDSEALVFENKTNDIVF